MSDRRILPSQLERMVYETIRDEIVSGALRPGEQLVEGRLAAELGVSKTPVREALIRLQRDGLVEIAPYRGARVIVPVDDDIAEITELRVCLETFIARDIAARRPTDVLEALETSIAGSCKALADRAEEQFVDRLSDFSDILAEACGNKRMKKILGDLRSVLHFIGNSSRRIQGRAARSIAQHEAILEAIKAGDPDAAAEATAVHIRSIAEDCRKAQVPNGDGRLPGPAANAPRAKARTRARANQ